MVSYFSTYHDFYIENFDKYRDRLSIVPREIHACKLLASQLLRSIEGKSARLNMPTEEGVGSVMRLINHVDEFILLYSENKTTLFDILNDFLSILALILIAITASVRCSKITFVIFYFSSLMRLTTW